MYTLLIDNNITGIVHYYCYFECKDDISKAPNNGALCKGQGNTMRILVMEYIKNKSFALHKWHNTDIIKSLIKQVLCISVDAFLKFGFVHGDLHCNNILFKKSTRELLIFIIDGKKVTINTNGYKAKLMDFELSKINQSIHVFYNDIALCFASSLIRYIAQYLQNPLFLNDITREMMKLRENAKIPIDAKNLLSDKMFSLIDKL